MDPKQIHDAEQIAASVVQMASLVAVYVRELTERHGFSRAEALKVAIGWQAAILGAQIRKPED